MEPLVGMKIMIKLRCRGGRTAAGWLFLTELHVGHSLPMLKASALNDAILGCLAYVSVIYNKINYTINT